MGVPIVMEQPTDPSGIEAFSGMVCQTIPENARIKSSRNSSAISLKTLYGLKQAREIWGSVLCVTLMNGGFRVTNIDRRCSIHTQRRGVV